VIVWKMVTRMFQIPLFNHNVDRSCSLGVVNWDDGWEIENVDVDV
jgi:hypothetical protein